MFLLLMSYWQPVWVAYFIIAFGVYWLLLVIFLGIHLVVAYQKMKKNTAVNWRQKCYSLDENPNQCREDECLSRSGLKWRELVQVIIFPV
ncbi:MAG: hypothetical protein KAJ48_10200, partial [Elusimicrobiales bacterium]|nr:hypothetical protein [Elusimicrobiales bacterium]